ncbi:DNA alkylation repair protein [Candidatus Woesebacteria bacterium]|nr:DNA alkylation repair protein [Candidatus Woesebacteria bacterium]MCB9801635.1 DNA alkylation repair protein [Pseudomonadales bacterium]
MEYTAQAFTEALAEYARPERARHAQRFFKTGKGEYGEGDVFIGVRVPEIRLVCNQFFLLPLAETAKLLESSIHEHRLAGVIILVKQYRKADQDRQQSIFDLYLAQLYKGNINNWDIIDASCHQIVGQHLLDAESTQLLVRLARSDSLWQRRVAIVSTFAFIRLGQSGPTIEVARLLLYDQEDLIHKATGWMLREMGKRVSLEDLREFLQEHVTQMPRTMLRYAIERLPDSERQEWLHAR